MGGELKCNYIKNSAMSGKKNNSKEKVFQTGAAAPGEEQRNNRAVSGRGTGAAARGAARAGKAETRETG